jgi:hypothetical protein
MGPVGAILSKNYTFRTIPLSASTSTMSPTSCNRAIRSAQTTQNFRKVLEAVVRLDGLFP